jgi:predicted GNAT family acetyltransferase
MTGDITITHAGNDSQGEYTAHIAGIDETGELSWRAQGAGVRVATHTGVPPSMQGRGIAAKLVDALIADAREQGFKIVPACSYVASQFKRHPEWTDLRA